MTPNHEEDIADKLTQLRYDLNPLLMAETGDFPGADRDFIQRLAQQLPGPGTMMQPEVAALLQQRYPEGSAESAEWAQLEWEALQELGTKPQITGVRRNWRGIHFAWSAVRLPERVVRVLASGPCLGDAPENEAWAGVPAPGLAALEASFALQDTTAELAGQTLAAHLYAKEVAQQALQSERTRSLGTLSSGISHHFNGLLSVILGYASFILNREDTHGDTKAALRRISEAAQRGRRFTEELLSFSGTEADDEMVCQVHDSMENVLSLLQSQEGGRPRIERHFEATEHRVYAIPSDIHQIVFSLVSLVLERCPPKDAVQVRTHNVAFSHHGDARHFLGIEVGASTALTTGAKLDEAKETQREIRMTHLYGMVRRLEGTVVMGPVSAAPRIEVLLPVNDGGEQDLTPERRVKPRRTASTIWVVDDDPLFREMCRQVLSEEGHQVTEFPEGSSLQQQFVATAERPDLFLVDFSMPDWNGLEVRCWIRDQGCNVPVVLVSGLAPSQPDIKRALEMRKTYFLQKPFSFQELADMASIAMGETLIGE